MNTCTDRFSLRRSRVLSFLSAVLAAIALLVFASSTFADPAGPPAEFPALGFMINDHGGGPPLDVNPPGVEIAGSRNRFSFTGEEGRPGAGRWHIQWDINVNPDPFIFADIIVTNNLPVDQEFTFTLNLPISPAISGGTLIGGSFSGVLKDRNANGAVLSVLDGANPPPIYSARIDGNEVQMLFDNPGPIEVVLPFQTNTFGPEHFGTPIPSLAGPAAVNSTISIVINLKLSAMDSANLSGSFIVEPVPEPSTLVLCICGAIGLLSVRRRRRMR